VQHSAAGFGIVINNRRVLAVLLNHRMVSEGYTAIFIGNQQEPSYNRP
jgi:hypothetical protein